MIGAPSRHGHGTFAGRVAAGGSNAGSPERSWHAPGTVRSTLKERWFAQTEPTSWRVTPGRDSR